VVQYRRGDIVIAVIEDKGGAEKHGKRPCLIIQNDRANLNPAWRLTIIVPITGRPTRYPFDVHVHSGEGGLREDSTIDCSQITVIDKSKIIHRIGSVSAEVLSDIEDRIRITLDLQN
jgi:mRNA interferase MazF